MPGFIVCSASRAGSKHGFIEDENQDAYTLDVTEGNVFLAVCDGAGSRRHSRIGANIVVGAAVDFLSAIEWTKPFSGQAKEFLANAQQALTRLRPATRFFP